MALLDKIGKAVTRAGAAGRSAGISVMGGGGGVGKAAFGVALAGGALAGLSNVANAGIDNAMDIAFDNPQADRAVLGTDLSPSLLLGEAGLGAISGAARNMNALKYGVNTGPGLPIATTAGAAALGGMGGAGLGFKMKGIKGMLAGGAIGSIVGGSVGGGIGIAPTAAYLRQNQQLLKESPFSNTSLVTADALNASGDIVFGMHNSRRGY